MRALAVTLAAGAVAASACGGSSAEPRTAPPLSASPASAAPPTPAAPDIPAAARPATSAGAEAFARFFYAQLKLAFETKNPELVRALSSPGCASCDRFITSITKLRDNDERVENFNMNVLLAIAPAVTGDSARVDVSWSAPLEMVRFDANGKVLNREGPFKRADDQVNLTRQDDGWRVAQLRTLRITK